MIFTDYLHAEESPCREVYKQNSCALTIFYSEIPVFIFKQKGRFSRPISFFLNHRQTSPTPFGIGDYFPSTLDHFKKNKI